MLISERHIWTVTQNPDGRELANGLRAALERAGYSVSEAETTVAITVVGTRHTLAEKEGSCTKRSKRS